MRKKARILISILIAVLLCVCFCACQKDEQKDVTTSDTVLRETTAASAEQATTAKPAESTQTTAETTRPAYMKEQTTTEAYSETEQTKAASFFETAQALIDDEPEETTTAFGSGAPVEDVTEELQRDRELQLLLQLSDPVDYDSAKEALCIERLQSICSGEITILYSPEKPYPVEGQTIKTETDVNVTTPEESLEWLAENIYNIKSSVIKKFKKDCSGSTGMSISSEKGGTIIFENGSYVGVRPAASKPVYYCSVVSAEKSKDKYQVRYMLAGYASSKKIYCTAILKQNEVDGQTWWSILSVRREPEA